MLNLENLKSILSFKFDAKPMSDEVYASLGKFVNWLHNAYFRTTHMGEIAAAMESAKKEHLIIISNHALTIEAMLIAWTLYREQAGKIGTLVYPDAFKIPIIREFLKACQCSPVSVNCGVNCLKDRHVLLFPEGMDFLPGLDGPESMHPFHSGFLRIAQNYLKESGRKTVRVLPVAHVGIEKSLKFWVIRNKLFMDLFIRPWSNYPFWIIPKLPVFLPTRVVMNWGKPIRVHRNQIDSPEKLLKQCDRFHDLVRDMRKEADQVLHHYNGEQVLPFYPTLVKTNHKSSE